MPVPIGSTLGIFADNSSEKKKRFASGRRPGYRMG